MKTQILSVLLIIAISTSIFTACDQNKPSSETNNADTIPQPMASVDTPADLELQWEQFRRESEKTMKDFDDSITAARARMKALGKKMQLRYDTTLTAMEQKNRELKNRLQQNKETGKEKFEAFKREFNHDMKELGQAIKDMGRDNVK